MPTFRVTAPDGNEFDVDAPEGATMDDALAYAQENYKGGPSASAQPEPGASAMPDAGTSENGAPQGIWARVKDSFTGASRTEFPDAPEFARAFTGATHRIEPSVMGSAVTPDPRAQLDILKKSIPGIESKEDRHGNIMLKTPEMGDWAYLNKPGLSTRDVDEVGTQTLATLPFMGLFGAGGSLAGRAAVGAGAGAGASITQDVAAIAQGSEQGIDPAAAAISAGFGGVAAPGVPSAIASGTASVVDAATRLPRDIIRGAFRPDDQAARNVAGALARDSGAPNITGQQLDALTRNRLATAAPAQDARIMDAGGETTRGVARSAANVSPEARETLMEVIQPRFETQAARSVQALRDIAGTPGNATQVQAGIEQAADAFNGPLYRAAYQAGAAGVNTPTLDRLVRAPAVVTAMEHAAGEMANRQAIGRLQTAINGPNGHPTLETWDQVARSLGDQESTLRDAGRMAEAANVGGLRQAIQHELDTAIPEFRQARGTAATFFGASDALDAGRRVATGAFNASDARDTVGQSIATGRWTPDQIDAARARMTGPEQRMFREGYVSAWVDRLNRAGDNRNVVTMLNGNPQVRDEMEAVLGPNRARELTAFMNAERMIDRVRGAVGGNSTTARQLMEIGLATTAGASVSGFNPNDPVGYIVGFLTYRGIHGRLAAVDRRVAEATARMLVSNDPAVFQRGLRQLGHSRMLQSLQAADMALSGPGRAAAAFQAGNASRGETEDTRGARQ